jgi:DNA-binding MarR family transcriptional regulator
LARALSDKDWTILQALRDKGAATATDLAVHLRVMPDDVRPILKSFADRGLVEVAPIGVAFEPDVYRVSDKGHLALRLRLPHPV